MQKSDGLSIFEPHCLAQALYSLKLADIAALRSETSGKPGKEPLSIVVGDLL
jgi:hypothetical protein